MEQEKRSRAAEIAQLLNQLYPQDPMGVLRAFRWLYTHQELGAALCGKGRAMEAGSPELLGALRREGLPEYMALAAFSLVLESKNDTGENER